MRWADTIVNVKSFELMMLVNNPFPQFTTLKVMFS